MNKSELQKLLKEHNQEHLLCFWNEANDEQKDSLVAQIKSIDFELLNNLIRRALEPQKKALEPQKMRPGNVLTLEQRQEKGAVFKKRGKQLLAQGKVAAFLVAGGQGSRLGFNGPKGMFKITPIKKKSLFRVHAEKILAVSRKYSVAVPWYIMTSRANHNETLEFFEKENFFGLNKKDIMFFEQDMLPAVDKEGKILFEEKHRIFMSPNGHGGALKAIWDSGALKDMRKRGIEQLFYFQVDNVLTYICDPVFIGFHLEEAAEMSNKVVHKAYPEEKMGVICDVNARTALVEYSDLSNKDMLAKNKDGSLKYWAGSIATHMISVDFIERENANGFRLPYHVAEKNVPYVDCHGKPVNPTDKNAYKFETFIFDALDHCKKSSTIEVRREEEFSALKNETGLDSPQTVHKDLVRLYHSWLHEADIKLGQNSGNTVVEISPLFAPDKESLIEQKDKIEISPREGSVYIE